MKDPRDPILIRVMDKATLNPLTGCWEWMAYTTPKGYARVNGGKPGQPAYGVAYRLLVGDFQGLELDHTCTNRACINPAHLDPVTHQENVRRAGARGNMGTAQKAKTHCPKGHPYSGDNLYIRPDNGCRKCRTCVSAQTKAARERRKARK